MPVHVSAEELAEGAAGLLDPDQAATVAAHLRSCAQCRGTDAAVRGVPGWLAALPTPVMPERVRQRLNRIVRDEAARRPGGDERRPVLAPVTRRTLGEFRVPPRPRRRVALAGLAAAAMAGVVGFGGYLASASAGLNEPPVAPTAVTSEQLDQQVGAIESGGQLGVHRFSRAWECAHAVVRGSITGLTEAYVDGHTALLVFTETGGKRRVSVVTGCTDDRGPQVRQTVVLPG